MHSNFRSGQSDQSDKAAHNAEVAGNVMIGLICQETYLLARQIARLATDFEQEGGFTERLHRIRTEIRKRGNYKRIPAIDGPDGQICGIRSGGKKAKGKSR